MNIELLGGENFLRESNFSGDYLLNDTSYNDDFQILEDMGYKPNMIKKVYAFLRPASLEEAINFMTEENGIYSHNFFKDYKHKKTTCYICGQPKEYHINYENDELEDEIENEIEIDDDKLKFIEKKEEKDFTCNICGENIKLNSSNVTKNSKCGDEYCNHCWFSYLRSKIEEGYVNKIKCMNYTCKEILSDTFIRNIIKDNKTLIEKYEKFLAKTEILNNPNKKFCPKKGCESYAEKIGKEKYVQCKNGHKFCFNCMRDWHGKEECEKKDEEDFKIWKKGKIIKQCPNCKMWTEKNEGCNHMTCAECKFQWCWLCGEKYSLNHYREGKCNGLQFYKPTSEEDISRVLKQGLQRNNVNSNWRNSEGLINFRFYNTGYDINNPLRDFYDLNWFVKFLYILQYIFLGFNYIGIRECEVADRRINRIGYCSKYYFNWCYYIHLIISSPIFLVPRTAFMVITMIPSFFYYQFFYKIWIHYWIEVVDNNGRFRYGY